MSATATAQNRSFEVPPGMKTPLVISGMLHVAIVIVALVGLPYFKAPPEPVPTSIAVEILPIAELTTANKPPVTAPPKPVEEPKPQPEQKKPPAPPKVDTVEPPKETPKPPVEKPKPKPKPVAPPPPEALKAPEPEPKPIEKPKEEPVEADPPQDFASLLKNLQDSAPDVPQPTPEAPKTDAAPAPSPAAPFSEQLTMSEFDALTQQLQRCWSIQAGARYAEDLVVKVRLTVSSARKVMSATIVDQWRYGQDSYFRAAADSAIRAVNSPQCETLILPPDKYNVWKDMVVTFDPREML